MFFGQSGVLDDDENYLYSDRFKIKIQDGSYEYIGEFMPNFKENDDAIRASEVKPFTEFLHTRTENTSIIDIGITSINISGKSFSKQGYFFNKCDFIIPSDEYIYFFGVPAKRNRSAKTILFKYSKKLKCIQEEFELPFRTIPMGVHDFFGKGILIFERSVLSKKENYNLWLTEDIYL